MINTRSLKEDAAKFPEPLKSLILNAKDEMPQEEFITQFLEWRKISRIKEATK